MAPVSLHIEIIIIVIIIIIVFAIIAVSSCYTASLFNYCDALYMFHNIFYSIVVTRKCQHGCWWPGAYLALEYQRISGVPCRNGMGATLFSTNIGRITGIHCCFIWCLSTKNIRITKSCFQFCLIMWMPREMIQNGALWDICLMHRGICCHYANFVVSGGTVICRFDNLQSHQWWLLVFSDSGVSMVIIIGTSRNYLK